MRMSTSSNVFASVAAALVLGAASCGITVESGGGSPTGGSSPGGDGDPRPTATAARRSGPIRTVGPRH